MNKHTPAPWTFNKDSNEVVAMRSDAFIAEINYVSITKSKSALAQEMANGYLIAAAPDLLEALKEAVEIIKKHTYPCPDKPLTPWSRADEFEAIIAKAEGK